MVAGTDTLCGAIANMYKSVHKLIKGARCSLVEALEAASLHPAQAIGADDVKGHIGVGADADFIMINRYASSLIALYCVSQPRKYGIHFQGNP